MCALGLIFEGVRKMSSIFSATAEWVTFFSSSTIVSISGTTKFFRTAALMAPAVRTNF
jgi:hypothetical protein